MKIMKVSAFFAILMGTSIIGIWTLFYLTGSIPEIYSEPSRIALHLLAEALTGFGLILGGFGLFKNKKWGYQIYLISMGMLLYTLICSPGYYAQKGNYIFVSIFGILFVISAILIIFSLFVMEKYNSDTRNM